MTLLKDFKQVVEDEILVTVLFKGRGIKSLQSRHFCVSSLDFTRIMTEMVNRYAQKVKQMKPWWQLSLITTVLWCSVSGFHNYPASVFPMTLPSRWQFLHSIKKLSETQMLSELPNSTELHVLRGLRFRLGFVWFQNFHSVYENRTEERGGRWVVGEEEVNGGLSAAIPVSHLPTPLWFVLTHQW